MEQCDKNKNCAGLYKFICSKPSYTNDMKCYDKPTLKDDCAVLGKEKYEDIDALLSPGRTLFAPETDDDLAFLKALDSSNWPGVT